MGAYDPVPNRATPNADLNIQKIFGIDPYAKPTKPAPKFSPKHSVGLNNAPAAKPRKGKK